MAIQLKSLRFLIKCEIQTNLSRCCSSEVQLHNAKQRNEAVRVRVAVSSTGISFFFLIIRKTFSFNKIFRFNFSAAETNPKDSLRSNSLRLALYSYLFASANQGQFIIRIENLNKYNTDNPWNRQSILDGLQWAGIVATESPIRGGAFGPYETSQRLQIYQQYVQELLANRKAYYCFCPRERLKELEKRAMVTDSLKYDGKCRYVSRERVADKLANNEPKQIR